jgi:hypothetical protein
MTYPEITAHIATLNQRWGNFRDAIHAVGGHYRDSRHLAKIEANPDISLQTPAALRVVALLAKAVAVPPMSYTQIKALPEAETRMLYEARFGRSFTPCWWDRARRGHVKRADVLVRISLMQYAAASQNL